MCNRQEGLRLLREPEFQFRYQMKRCRSHLETTSPSKRRKQGLTEMEAQYKENSGEYFEESAE